MSLVSLSVDRDVFAAQRRKLLADNDQYLLSSVRRSLRNYGQGEWWRYALDAAERVFRRVFREESGQRTHPNLADAVAAFRDEAGRAIRRTSEPRPGITAGLLARWLSTAAVNAATTFATSVDPEDLGKEWVTMRDDKVRDTHRLVDGQTVPVHEQFRIDGVKVDYPGQPKGDPALWINCRCVSRPSRIGALAVRSSTWRNDGSGPSTSGSSRTPSPDQMDASTGRDASIATGTASSGPEESLPARLIASHGSSRMASSQRTRLTTSVRTTDASMLSTCETQPTPSSTKIWTATGEPRHTAHEDMSTPQRTPGGRSDPRKVPASASVVPALEKRPVNDVAQKRQYIADLADGTRRPAKIGTAEGGTMTTATDDEPVLADAEQDEAEPADQGYDEDEYDFEPIPWHGVLAPEGVVSGDKRRFAAGALTWRDLPLPLSWQRISDERHKGSVVVGQIQNIWRDNGLIKASGVWDQSPEADEAFRMVVDNMLRGVSVDVDEVTMEFQSENGRPAEPDGGIATFTQGRICGATLVAIPAFQEAFVAVGEPLTAAGVTDKPWDGSASRFTPEQYYRSTVLHRNGRSMNKADNSLPIREPDGTLNRNAVHSAAAALRGARGGVKGASSSAIAAAKSAIRGAYRQLGETPPEGFGVGELFTWEDSEAFARGPGWATNPAGTRRLHDYWVHGPGAAKIRWGVPRDFYRCRDQVGEEIGESSPAKLRFINQICAQWHKDAIGLWPGQEDGGRGHHRHNADTEAFCSSEACRGPAALVASAGTTSGSPRRAEFFTNPNLVMPSPAVVTREGRIFGHLATWGTCHIGIGNACVTAPKSATNYAYFHTGQVDLDDGRSIAVGHITLGGGHADRFAGYRAAIEHYDDAGTVAADVVCGEDEWGIWFSGQVRDLTDEQLTALRSAPLSGDWRPIGSGLELVAALCVNVPGFPIPRAAMAMSAGQQCSLVAAGMLLPRAGGTDAAQLASAVADELELRQRRRRMSQLRNRERIARLRG